MEFRQFEREFLRLAFTTDVDLSAPSLAFLTGVPIAEAEVHLGQLVDLGTLELDSDDEGHLRYVMPDRPGRPMALDHPALVGHRDVRIAYVTDPEIGASAPSKALIVRRMSPVRYQPGQVSMGQAMAATFVNALICPGVGSMIGGKTGVGLAQLAMFVVGLPLAAFTVGLPLMIVAWVWAVVSGVQLLSEARD